MKIKNPWKSLTIALLSYPLLLIVSFLLMFFLTLTNYQFLIGAKDYYSLYDWDYPATVEGDFNNDGKEDYITSGGCAYFDAKQDIKNEIMCEPYYSGNNPLTQNLHNGYPNHSYIIKENNLWNILVLDNNFQFSKYQIQNNGTISKISPDALDVLRELLYTVPVFLTFILISPLFYLLTILGYYFYLLYIIAVATCFYMLKKTKRKTHSKTK